VEQATGLAGERERGVNLQSRRQCAFIEHDSGAESRARTAR
jgi:hypothetical protein